MRFLQRPMASPPPLHGHVDPETASYQALGDLMGAHPEIAIFRRFRNAAATDLLYRQADLQHTIDRWAKYSRADRVSREESRRCFDYNVNALQDSEADWETGKQWREWCEVSEKLDKYYDKLLRFQKICGLAKADSIQFQQLARYLEEKDKGGGALRGSECDLYDKLYRDDLTSAAYPEEPDFFTKLIIGPIYWRMHRYRRSTSGRTIDVPRLAKNDGGSTPGRATRALLLEAYSDDWAMIVARLLYALVYSSLILIAVIAFSYLHGGIKNVLPIFWQTLFLAMIMASFTQVKPAQLFGVAAAHAAVLIGFYA